MKIGFILTMLADVLIVTDVYTVTNACTDLFLLAQRYNNYVFAYGYTK